MAALCAECVRIRCQCSCAHEHAICININLEVTQRGMDDNDDVVDMMGGFGRCEWKLSAVMRWWHRVLCIVHCIQTALFALLCGHRVGMFLSHTIA